MESGLITPFALKGVGATKGGTSGKAMYGHTAHWEAGPSMSSTLGPKFVPPSGVIDVRGKNCPIKGTPSVRQTVESGARSVMAIRRIVQCCNRSSVAFCSGSRSSSRYFVRRTLL